MSRELNELTREIAAQYPAVGPREIAQKVAEATPKSVLIGFYADALVGTVREILRQDRNTALDRVFNRNRSPKLERRRAAWAALLDTELHVGDSEWKLLGDCGRADLDFAINFREDQITRIGIENERLRKIRRLLDEHNVDYAKDLPKDVIPVD